MKMEMIKMCRMGTVFDVGVLLMQGIEGGSESEKKIDYGGVVGRMWRR